LATSKTTVQSSKDYEQLQADVRRFNTRHDWVTHTSLDTHTLLVYMIYDID